MSFKRFKLTCLLLTLPSLIDPLCAAEMQQQNDIARSASKVGRASDSTKYANLFQEDDGGLVVKMTKDMREEFRKNPELIQKQFADPLTATLSLLSFDENPSMESLLQKEMICKNLIHFRLQRYTKEANAIANEIFGNQYFPTEKNLDVFLCKLNELNMSPDKRGVSAFLIRLFDNKINEFAKNKNLVSQVVKESKLLGNACFLKLGQEMLKKIGQIPSSLAEDYYTVMRPFWLSGIMELPLGEVARQPLSSRITEANIQQIERIASTPKEINQKKENLESLLSFVKICQVQDDWALSYQGSLLMYEAANLPRSQAFLNSMKAIEITELLNDDAELVQPYLSAFLTVHEGTQQQQLIRKFNQFTPKFFDLYEKCMESENPLDRSMISFCNILFSSYVALLKQQNVSAVDERVEGFKTAALEAKEAKKAFKEAQTVQGKQKVSQEHLRQKIETSLQAKKEKDEKKQKAKIALEELHQQHMIRNQQVLTSNVDSLPTAISLQPSSQNFTKEGKEAARLQIEKEKERAEKHQQRSSIPISTTSTTTTTPTISTTPSSRPQDDKIAQEFDNSPDSLKQYLKERNSLVAELKPTPVSILRLFFDTKNGKGKSWNNDIEITMDQLESVVKALKGKIDKSRGKGGHFMLFFGQKQVAELYNPAMALKHIEGPLASLATTGKLWDSNRLPPYLIEQLRNIFITLKIVPTDF